MRHLGVAFATFVLSLIHVVVELLGHGVVEVELLVRAKHIAGETQNKREVRTESLECVADSLAGGSNSLGGRVLSESHGEPCIERVSVVLSLH